MNTFEKSGEAMLLAQEGTAQIAQFLWAKVTGLFATYWNTTKVVHGQMYNLR